MKKNPIIVFLLSIAQLCCFEPANSKKKTIDEIKKVKMAKILKAEDSRNERQLIELARSIEDNMSEIVVRIALASGRIPSFKVWKSLSSKFKKKEIIADALAIAVRFPMNQFPKDEVFHILQTFIPTKTVVETFLYLNLKEAFDYVLSLNLHEKTVANNLWRSKDYLTKEILKKYFENAPEATVYSVYRSKIKGIVKTEDIKSMELRNRFYGCMICDHPEEFLTDPAWQVRIAAIKNSNSIKTSERLLSDPNPLVRVAALQVYIENKGNPDIIMLDKLNPMEAEIVCANSNEKSLVKNFFAREGIFREVSAPFLGKKDKPIVLSSSLSDRAKVLFLENQFGKQEAISYAKKLFLNKDSSFALQYLLDQKDGVQKDKIVEAAQKKRKFISELGDFGFVKTEPVNRPLTFYSSLLKEISKYHGFKILTQKGTIVCTFYHQDAPMTCYNFIELVKIRYFDKLNFHRVVPAFVTQDGDPTGTGSGGPGFSIRCEYNGITYNRQGMVGMALAGKDTGGSQYFLTHLPTPHLNHSYTIFAQVINGIEVLSETCQYDQIHQIRLF